MNEDKERRERYENALEVARHHGNRMFEAAILKEIRMMDQKLTGKTIVPDPVELEAIDDINQKLRQLGVNYPTTDESDG